MSQNKSWKEISLAGVCWKPSTQYLTGDWKTYTPVIDSKICTRCLLCVLFCPDGAIKWIEAENQVEIDLTFCKGCGICANECPVKAINMALGSEG